jgi:DNA-binding NarL/FixJ family response regulator
MTVAGPAQVAVQEPGQSISIIGRIVLIDPREERRAIMSLLVELSPVLSVVGLAGTLDEAETLIRSEQADTAVIEIQMPIEQGLATVAGLRARFPDLRIVVCSFHLSLATQEAARRDGADGYLPKPLDLRDLVKLVERPPLVPRDGHSPAVDPLVAVASR